MKQKRSLSITRYVPVLLILLSVSIMVGSTFAYFTHNISRGGVNPLTFGEVSLSEETSVELSGSLMDAIAGTVIIDDEISFKLSDTSRPAYVRAKISYSGDSVVQSYLTSLRQANNEHSGIISDVQNSLGKWKEKSGNYVYLVSKDNEDVPLRVATTDKYILMDSFAIPTSAEQITVGNNKTAQYMAQAKFHLAFQAIQADNLENTSLEAVASLFDQLFPESEAEKYTATVTPEEPSQVSNATLLGAEDSPSVDSNFLGVDGLTRSSIQSITFDGASSNQIGSGALVSGALSNAPASYNISAYVSANQDGSIMLYAVQDNETEKYDVTICSDKVIKTPADSSYLFSGLVNCTTLNLTNVDMSNITTISNSMFSDCRGLTSFTIPSSVTSIGNNAFSSTGLTTITIPNGVTTIGSGAFAGTGLTSVSIPASVTNLGDIAFDKCDAITSITVDSGNAVYDSRNNCNAIIHTNSNALIVGCNNTTIPNTVTRIANSAFTDRNISTITIPNSVTEIQSRAFAGSTLSRIVIPNTVTTMGDSVFFGCHNLTMVQLSKTLTSIPDDTFDHCTSLPNIVIPNGVQSIGAGAFFNCTSLTSVAIPSSVTSVGSSAFGYAQTTQLSKIYFSGNQSQWDDITIENGNNVLDMATKTYNCKFVVDVSAFNNSNPDYLHNVTYNGTAIVTNNDPGITTVQNVATGVSTLRIRNNGNKSITLTTSSGQTYTLSGGQGQEREFNYSGSMEVIYISLAS